MPTNAVSDATYMSIAQSQCDAATQIAYWDLAILSALLINDGLIANMRSIMLTRIAAKQIQLATEAMEHWEKFLPGQVKLLDDVYIEPEYRAQYRQLCDQFKDICQDAFYANHDDYLDNVSKLCPNQETLPCQDSRWKTAMALATADSMSFAARTEEEREVLLNDQRYSKRYNVLMLGKGILQQIASLSTAMAKNPPDLLGGLVRMGVEAFKTVRPAGPVETAPQAWRTDGVRGLQEVSHREIEWMSGGNIQVGSNYPTRELMGPPIEASNLPQVGNRVINDVGKTGGQSKAVN